MYNVSTVSTSFFEFQRKKIEQKIRDFIFYCQSSRFFDNVKVLPAAIQKNFRGFTVSN